MMMIVDLDECLILSMLGRYDESQARLVRIAAHAMQYGTGNLLRISVACALLLEHHEEYERSIELLSACLHYETDILLIAHLPHVKDAQSRLRERLGNENYEAAWDRGKARDLKRDIRTLLDEWTRT